MLNILHKKVNKVLQEPDWLFVTFWNLKSLYFTCSHLFSLIVPYVVICFHSLPFVVTRRHLMYQPLSLSVTRCATLCNSLSLVAIRSHSLSLDVPLFCIFINDLNFFWMFVSKHFRFHARKSKRCYIMWNAGYIIFMWRRRQL